MNYFVKYILIFLLVSCEGSSSDCCVFPDLREEIIINKGILQFLTMKFMSNQIG